MRFLQNASIEARLVFAISLMTVTPLGALSQAYLSIQENIHFAEKETLGAATLTPVTQLLSELAVARTALALGKPARTEALSERMAALYAALTDHETAETLQFTQEGLASRGREAAAPEALKREWEALLPLLRSGQAAILGEGGALAAFIAHLCDVARHIGDTSNLVLDPDPDSYYVMDVVTAALPRTLVRAGDMAEQLLHVDSSSSPEASPPTLGHAESPGAQDAPKIPDARAVSADMTKAAALRKMLTEADAERIVVGLKTAFNEDARYYGEAPAFKARMLPLLEAYQAAAAGPDAQLKRMEEGKSVQPAEAKRAVLGYVAASTQLAEEGGRRLESMLHARMEAYQSKKSDAVVISLLGAVLSLIFYHFVVVGISRPLLALNQVLRKLAAGEYDVDVPHAVGRSEIGQIARSMQACKENGLQSLQFKRAHDRAVAEALDARRREMLHLADWLDKQVAGAVNSLTASSAELKQSSTIVKDTADESVKAGEMAAHASAVAEHNVRSVVQAIDRITSGAGAMAHQVSEVAAKAAAAGAEAAGAGRRMKELNESVSNIGEVILSIKQIAEQTNLLALNAAIEAARSGEYGRGFAVVAEEVKKLAAETARKTGDIEERISGIVQSAKGAAEASEEVIGHVNDIDALAARASASAEEQNAVTGEISQSIGRVSEAAGEMNAVISRIGASAERTGGAASKAAEAAERVSGVGDELGGAVRQFLEIVRANTKAGAA